MPSVQNSVVKVAVVGSGGCGKTTWINRIHTGQFNPIYNPTQFEQRSLILNTNHYGHVQFDISEFGGMYNEFDSNSTEFDGIIVMFAVDSHLSFQKALEWKSKINFPILCGSKCDLRERKVVPSYQQIQGCQYFDISGKSNYNLEKPLLAIIRTIFQNDLIHFVV